MIHESSSIDVCGERPVDSVLNFAWFEERITFSNSPNFL
jgi:hypothetical protein